MILRNFGVTDAGNLLGPFLRIIISIAIIPFTFGLFVLMAWERFRKQIGTSYLLLLLFMMITCLFGIVLSINGVMGEPISTWLADMRIPLPNTGLFRLLPETCSHELALSNARNGMWLAWAILGLLASFYILRKIEDVTSK